MTFLPIVGRELRVASRKRETYWTRSLLALGAVVVGVWFFGFSAGLDPQHVAQYVFRGLSVLGLIYALLAGRRFTADCLSSEKREGTLGLLFLTDLEGYDVVFGKLAATSLSGFFGLLALVPVLAVPMMMGGISRDEIWRMVLVLVNTFWFSLATGIFVSALSREARRAFGANFSLLLAITALPAVVMGVIYLTSLYRFSARGLIHELFYSCPIYSFVLCFDLQYVTQPKHFWRSLEVLHGLSWLLILMTCWIVPRCWQDRPSGVRIIRWREWWERWAYGSGAIRAAFRKRLLDVNAFYWLAARVRPKPAMVWAFLVFMVGWWVYVSAKAGSILMFEALVVTTLILNSTIKLWVAVETGQRLGEDQSIGALELLLSTRLTVPDILRGQFLALQRQFFWPLVVVILVELFFTAVLMKRFNAEAPRMFLTGMASIAILVADLVALVWVAMSSGLTSKNPNQAIVRTISRVLILPWVLFGAGAAVVGLVSSMVWTFQADWRFYLSLWFWGGLLADIGFGVIAWSKVRTRFRELAAKRA